MKMEYKKSYESRKYGKPSAAEGKINGPLGTGDPTSHLKQRKLEGQLKADPHKQIPQPRGYCCSGSHS